MDYQDELSEDKQDRLNCTISRGINNWGCYNDCAFWNGEVCTHYESEV